MMNCPHCGAVVVSAIGPCAVCGRGLPSGAPAAIGLLTPPPVFQPDSATTELPYLADGRAISVDRTVDTAPTGLVPSLLQPDAVTAFAADSHPSAPSSNGGNTGPLAVGQSFGRRYHIIRVLGIGGMGAVYHAWDAELAMAVALKVIRPEATSDPYAAREMERRFKQELVLARQVTHKNVVRIHDLGEIDGIKYITMPYLEGADLASTLKLRGKMPIAEALRLVRDVAAGLVAAHEAGIVHRDLKPANIMVLTDRAVIMDFGIARSASGLWAESVRAPIASSDLALSRTQPTATAAGTILGTVQFMAPEQARGLPVDQRADVYALGLIFSDMLLGERSASADGGAAADLMRRMEHAPPPVRTIDPTIPDTVDRLITRCLAPDPAARFQSSAELLAELDRLDEKGEAIPVKRVVGLRLAAAVVALLLALSVATWWYTRQLIPPPPHDPVSVVISDFQNGTSEATFDRTLEPMLKLALEGAGFISAYDRAQMRTLGVQPPERLDEKSAREIAVKQGLGVVVSGSIDRQGTRYGVSMKAVQAVTGEVIIAADDRAPDKDQVLPVVTRLASELRTALGDNTSDSAQRFAMETLSATSLDVVREYAVAQQATSDGRFDAARASFSKAIALDPNFGYAYAAMGNAQRNLGLQQEAEKSVTEALRHIDRMTERERLRTRGLYYLVTGDHLACVKEYGALIERFPADASAHNNVALCSTYLRNLPKAVEEMRRVVQILPKRALYRVNLGLFAAYSSDFQTAEREALTAQQLGNPLGLLPLAFAYLGQNKLSEATAAYENLAKASAQGASFAASGLADQALYEGRYSDAARILQEGAAKDLASGSSDKAARKFVALAQTELLRKRNSAATAAAKTALTHSRVATIRFLAARTFVEGGDLSTAQMLGTELMSELRAEPRALAKIIEGEIALKNRNPRAAIQALEEGNALLDTWVGRFDLGRAYFEAGAFPQADSEFDRCLMRRGEALALFLDEEATYGLLPPVYYYQGRVREELKTAGFVESYRAYLDIRGKSVEDPLVAEVRRRTDSKLGNAR